MKPRNQTTDQHQRQYQQSALADPHGRKGGLSMQGKVLLAVVLVVLLLTFAQGYLRGDDTAIVAVHPTTTTITSSVASSSSSSFVSKRSAPVSKPKEEQQPQQSIISTTTQTLRGRNDRFVTVHRSLPHPSCQAEEYLRIGGGGGGGTPTEFLQRRIGKKNKFGKAEWNCYKHGGHTPGMPRQHGVYLTLFNVTYFNGFFYIPKLDAAEKRELTRSGVAVVLQREIAKRFTNLIRCENCDVLEFMYSGHFSMVSGEWPQQVQSRFLAIEREHDGNTFNSAVYAKRMETFSSPEGGKKLPSSHHHNKKPFRFTTTRIGYFQPATDYMSTYHVIVEVVATMFHRLLPFFPSIDVTNGDANEGVVTHHKTRGKENRRGGEGGTAHSSSSDTTELMSSTKQTSGGGTSSKRHRAADVMVFTSRPRKSTYGFKRGSCHFTSIDNNAIAPSSNKSASKAASDAVLPPCMQRTEWGRMFAHLSVNGDATRIYGIRGSEHQIVTPDVFEDRNNAQRGAANASAVAAETSHDIRVDMERLLVGNPTHCEQLWGPDAHYVEAAGDVVKSTPSFADCASTLRAFRNTILHRAYGMPSEFLDNAIPKPSRTRRIRILIASRKGSWARVLVNEEVMVEHIKAHLGKKYSDFDREVRVVRVGGRYEDQALSVHHEETTIYIGCHGANLIPSLFLRPNAGLITLSFSTPGFYPFSIVPPWVHYEDIEIDMECNRRLWKGKCKWSTPNNNDLLIKQPELKTLVETIDRFLVLQEEGR